jgi:hypothetical protein
VIHQNSIKAYRELSKSERCQAIFRVYDVHQRPLTDRQVKDYLGFSEMNAVRPRISEMIQQGVLVECINKEKDHVTGKTVRLVRIPYPNEDQQMELF